ncbi:MAG: thiamine-phosphate kinase [Actinobacteria bacterium]|nr:thiamine-phosphate kinase [Actinomycetota bacterium]
MAGGVGEGAGPTVGSLGEFGLIRELASRMPAGSLTSVGIGDDSAVVTAPSGSVVAAVDMVLEGRHFLRSWSSGRDVGIKAAARSLADIAAMGAVPTALLAAVALPGSLPASWALDLASGLAWEAERAGAGIIGGDTASAELVLVSVTALGDLSGAAPVRRSGAAAGDVVAVCGTLGHSAAGHALLSAGAREPTSLVAAHLRPAPPYDAGPEAARLGATAMIDVSDGLLADLGHVAEASGATIDVSSAGLVPPDDHPLWRAARSARTDSPDSPSARLLHWVLTGGEDHALAATFPPSAASQLPPRWRVIGTVSAAGRAGPGERVTVDGEPYAATAGWQHFR